MARSTRPYYVVQGGYVPATDGHPVISELTLAAVTPDGLPTMVRCVDCGDQAGWDDSRPGTLRSCPCGSDYDVQVAPSRDRYVIRRWRYTALLWDEVGTC